MTKILIMNSLVGRARIELGGFEFFVMNDAIYSLSFFFVLNKNATHKINEPRDHYHPRPI